MLEALDLGDTWYERTVKGVANDLQRYPAYSLKEGLLHRHRYHSLDYADRSNVWKLYSPAAGVRQILCENHDALVAGHCGIAKTISRVSSQYYWPRMRVEITDYVRQCVKYQVYKASQQPPSARMEIIPALRLWPVVAADVIGPKPRSSRGMSYLVAFQDKFTK